METNQNTTASTTTATTTASGSAEFFKRRNEGVQAPKPTLIEKTETASTTTQTTTPKPTETNTSTSTKPPTVTKKTTTKLPVAKGYRDVPQAEPNLETIKAVAKEVADAIINKKEAAPEAEPLTDEEKHEISVLAVMEELNPKKYPKGFAKKVADFIPKITEFETKTRAEKPDITDEELDELVAEFQKKNGVAFDQDDFEKAERKADILPIAKENERLRKEMEELRGKEQARELEPKAIANANAAGKEVASEFEIKADDGTALDIAAALHDDGTIDPDKLKAIEEADPIAAPIILDAVVRAQNFGMEVTRVFNDAKSDLRDQIFFVQEDLEKQMAALPEEERKDKKGRPYMGMIEFVSIQRVKNQNFSPTPKQCRAMIEKLGYCTTTEKALIAHASELISSSAKKNIETEREKVLKLAPKLGFKKETKETVTKAPSEPVEKPDTVSTPDHVPGPVSKAPAQTGGFWDRRKTGTQDKPVRRLT